MELDPHRAPLYEAIIGHANKGAVSFHVPGHKSGKGAAGAGSETFSGIMSIDFTEISGLDDLHHPQGAILEAQQLAAQCFGADATFFLVGGSTVGNMGMILSVCQPGELLLVQRNVHKSVINGLMLAGARAVFLPPRRDPHTGQLIGVEQEAVSKALDLYPEAKGVLVSNPNYYGLGMGLHQLAELVHRHDKPLLVDEAHGAHYGFHPLLPASAISCGADVVVQSTHKMLSALTMGAMLHVRGKRVEKSRLQQRLAMLQSSSPSYPIMASLDLSRMQMHTAGREGIQRGLDAVDFFITRLETLSCFSLLDKECDPDSFEHKDPFKVAVKDATGTLSGFRLQAALEQRGCYPEMADQEFVLLMFSLASSVEDAARAIAALESILSDYGLAKQENSGAIENKTSIPLYSAISSPVPFQLNFNNGKPVRYAALKDAVHRYSAEMVIPYPPGIPVLYPGERITQEAVHYLEKLKECGARFQGAAEPGLERICIFE